MSVSDDDRRNLKQSRLRKRRNSLLLLLLAGLLGFAAAAGGLYYALRPVTLRIAVGPPGSDDQKLVQAMAETFDRDRNAVRLSPIVTDGATQSLTFNRLTFLRFRVAARGQDRRQSYLPRLAVYADRSMPCRFRQRTLTAAVLLRRSQKNRPLQ